MLDTVKYAEDMARIYGQVYRFVHRSWWHLDDGYWVQQGALVALQKAIRAFGQDLPEPQRKDLEKVYIVNRITRQLASSLWTDRFPGRLEPYELPPYARD